ncbi:MAG TPA: type II toxin-antitoxin system prevent-host-death family antitoxin [Gammaproteobacteria bacterium]|nr:type II toxin-antitoxin system prevent-host-death family antitoxin [Gammaproteobacteria bacterium]
MDAKSYSSVRKELARTMEKVCDDHSPLIITRKNARAVVMMSLEDFNAIEETAYLLRNPANADRLRESIKQAAAGKTLSHDLMEERKTK